MSDLIERGLALEELRKCQMYLFDFYDNDKKIDLKDAEWAIMRLPSTKPEIINCFECTHYKPMSNSWGKCYVHSSRTERYRTCQSCDYCSWAERRQDD